MNETPETETAVDAPADVVTSAPAEAPEENPHAPHVGQAVRYFCKPYTVVIGETEDEKPITRTVDHLSAVVVRVEPDGTADLKIIARNERRGDGSVGKRGGVQLQTRVARGHDVGQWLEESEQRVVPKAKS